MNRKTANAAGNATRNTQSENSVGYTIIFIFCMVAIFIMTFIMLTAKDTEDSPPIHTPRMGQNAGEPRENEHQTPGENENENGEPLGTIVLDEDKIVEILRQELPEDFPLDELGATLKEGKLTLTGKAQKNDLVTWMKDNGVKLSATMNAAIRFLPATLEVKTTMRAECDQNNGLLKLVMEDIYLNGMEIPEDMVGTTFPEILSDAINRAICESGMYFTKISVTDGKMELQAVTAVPD